MKCAVMGPTGSVGQHLVKRLIKANAQITLLTRKDPSALQDQYDGKVRAVKFNFEDPSQNEADLTCDVFFCTHGTTRAQAGSADAFVKIDKTYVLDAARVFKKVSPNGHFLVVTATGSTPSSMLLYSKTKGQIEQELAQMKFRRLSIFRPAMLEGRPSDGRVLERMLGVVMPVVKWIAPQSSAVHVDQVAQAMVKVSQSDSQKSDNIWSVESSKESTIEVFSNAEIQQLAKEE